MSENKEREAFEAWLATSAQDISDADWTTQGIWLGGYRAALQAGGQEQKCRQCGHSEHPGSSCVNVAPAPVGEPAALTNSVREVLQLAEKTIDILWVSHHANRADEALEKIRALLATQPAEPAPADRQGVALSEEVWGVRIGDSDRWAYTNSESDADFWGKQSGLKYEKRRYVRASDRQSVALSNKDMREAFEEALPFIGGTIHVFSPTRTARDERYLEGITEVCWRTWQAAYSRASSSRAEVERIVSLALDHCYGRAHVSDDMIQRTTDAVLAAAEAPKEGAGE